jgi:hypothetical protein
MSGISLETANNHLQAWLKAELEITTSQSYRIGGRTLYRADLKQVREQIDYWRGIVNTLCKGRRRVKRAVPRDL